jgi:CBS-domain-containing membrane protein
MGSSFIATAEAGPLVRDVMLRDPNTVSPATTAGEARRIFESPRQKALLVCDGDRYLGAIGRDGLDGADDGAPLAGLVDAAAPTLGPEDGTARIFELVASTGLNRIPVVDAAGTLLGLVCFNRSRDAFCVA